MNISQSSSVMQIVVILVYAVLCNNLLLTALPALVPAEKKWNTTKAAALLGFCMMLLMFFSQLFNYALWRWVMEPLSLSIMFFPVNVLVVIGCCYLLIYFLKSRIPEIKTVLTNKTVLVIVSSLLMITKTVGISPASKGGGPLTLAIALANVVGLAFGYVVALIILTAVNERLAVARVPKALKGLPLQLISLGLISLAFMGFMGMIR